MSEKQKQRTKHHQARGATGEQKYLSSEPGGGGVSGGVSVSGAGDNHTLKHHQHIDNTLTSQHSSWCYSYILHLYSHILLCLLWGSLSLIIGIILVILSALIRSKTSSISLLESLPIYVPALVVSFHNEFSYLFLSLFFLSNS